MKLCKCGAPTEADHYNFCYDCWWDQDPRNVKNVGTVSLDNSTLIKIDKHSETVGVSMLTKREYVALEFAKLFLNLEWEYPITNAIEYTDTFFKKLEEKNNASR